MQKQMDETQNNHKALSLLELNRRVKTTLDGAFSETYWIQAETSDVRVNSSSGHCYLEFIEKNPFNNQLVAKVRGNIWANSYRILKYHFEQTTGQAFTSGLKVLVNVTIEFHELYGLSLTVVDIDPTYTLGDMARKRMEIFRQLQEEGVFDLNRELDFPALPQRIAIITSPTAAGYEDFLNQLMNNKPGYVFYTKLFPALMQGDKTESSIIAALDNIYQHHTHFDIVVIIRGGGSTADLSSFDSYLLAANCAQFPLPVITGIGHERDDTVLDMVAHTRLKTPTAVAEFLIEAIDSVATEITGIEEMIRHLPADHLLKENSQLQLFISRLPSVVSNKLEINNNTLLSLSFRLPTQASNLLSQHSLSLETMHSRLRNSTKSRITEENRQIELSEQFIRMVSPEYIMKRGYSLTLKNGKIIKKTAELCTGDTIQVRFSDGEIQGKVM